MSKKAIPILNAEQFASFMEGEMQSPLVWRYQRWELWRNFVFWMLAEVQDDLERSREVASRMPDAVDAWTRWRAALEECARASPLEDALGLAYMRIGGGSKEMKQYFTPQPIADLMAMVVGSDKTSPTGRLERCSEPTCGSGVLILASERHRRSQGLQPALWFAMDLDPTCAAMCALQCFLNDIPAIVLCGDGFSWGGEAMAQLVSPRVRVEQNGSVVPLREVNERQAGMILDNLEQHALEAMRLRDAVRTMENLCGAKRA